MPSTKQKRNSYITLIALSVLFSGFVFPNYAEAQESKVFISAAYLHQICARDENGAEKMAGGHVACQSYISGVIDYHNTLQSLGTSPNVDVCVPKQAKLNDLQEIVWHYLDKNAHHDAFVAAPAVTLALFQVFPCKVSKKKK